MKPCAVVSHPPFGVLGGGETVAAWTLQALVRDYEVTMLCRDPVDFAAIDERFGTALRAEPVRVATWPGWMRRAHRLWPGEGDRWRHLFQERCLQRLARGGRVAAWVSTFNESRLPAAGLQYVHFPAGDGAEGWAGRFYERIVDSLRGGNLAGPEAHRTLVNSRFTAAAWQAAHGRPAEVVYPPVPRLASGRAWSEREEHRMICLGRLLPGKGIERAARIVAGVRERGVTLTLAVVGGWCCSWRERRRMEQALGGLAWIEWRGELPRAQLAALAAGSRYGLHGMVAEPFGIAVAELQAAGCVIFAPAEGGPAEILDEPGQLYADKDDAVEKILAVVCSAERQAALHARARARADRFAPERFVAAIRARVRAMTGDAGGGR